MTLKTNVNCSKISQVIWKLKFEMIESTVLVTMFGRLFVILKEQTTTRQLNFNTISNDEEKYALFENSD